MKRLRKRWVAWLCAVAMLVSIIPAASVTVYAQNYTDFSMGQTLQCVLSNGVNFRSGPSTSYSAIGTIPYGGKVFVEGVYTSGTYLGWLKVTYNSTVGYCAGNEGYFKIVSSLSTENLPDGSYIVTNASTTVYKAPSVNSGTVTTISTGYTATATQVVSNGWIKLQLENVTGYVSPSTVTLYRNGSSETSLPSGSYITVTATGGVAARYSPSPTASLVTTLSYGKKATATALTSNNYVKITLENVTAYVPLSSVDLTRGGNSFYMAYGYLIYADEDGIPVYKTNDSSSTVRTIMAEDQYFTLYSENSDWYKVVVSDSVYGFIMKSASVTKVDAFEEITLNKSSFKCYTYSSWHKYYKKLKVLGADDLDVTILWTTGNRKIARISKNGKKVRGVRKGNTYLYCKITCGNRSKTLKVKCKVRVKAS